MYAKIKAFNYPKKSAYSLAQQMRKFRARTEEHAYSELNINADQDRSEVVRQIDWGKFNEVIEQLEFLYKKTKTMAHDNKTTYIQNIEGLFPPDSGYANTAEVGRKLLLQAIYENWRDLPEPILETFSRLCNREEMRQSRG